MGARRGLPWAAFGTVQTIADCAVLASTMDELCSPVALQSFRWCGWEPSAEPASGPSANAGMKKIVCGEREDLR